MQLTSDDLTGVVYVMTEEKKNNNNKKKKCRWRGGKEWEQIR
jgi:hypothetical protein